jgi:hypothetical protein
MLSSSDIEARRTIFMLLFRGGVIEATQGDYNLKLISSFQIARPGLGGRSLLLAGWAFLFFFLPPRRPAQYQIKTSCYPAHQHLINAYHDLNYPVIIGSFFP